MTRKLGVMLMLGCFSAAAMLCSTAAAVIVQGNAYAGTWTGSYTSGAGTKGSLRYVLSKDAKGLWGGRVTFSGDSGEQTADLKSVRIARGKFSAKIDAPDGQNEVAIEGTFRGTRLEGTYVVSSKTSKEKIDGGNWTTQKE